MSADRWSMCPRCVARDDVGRRGEEFREDFEIGQDDGVVTVDYHGECQRCGLLITFKDERPIPGLEALDASHAELARQPTSPDLADWWIQVNADDQFFLLHKPCQWQSNPQAYRSMADLLRWADRHACAPPRPRTDEARQLTWGQVPAGWYVKAPGGEWYQVESTRYQAATGQQMVTMLSKEWARLPAGPVTACPGAPSAVDAVVEALDYPEVLEDGL